MCTNNEGKCDCYQNGQYFDGKHLKIYSIAWGIGATHNPITLQIELDDKKVPKH